MVKELAEFKEADGRTGRAVRRALVVSPANRPRTRYVSSTTPHHRGKNTTHGQQQRAVDAGAGRPAGRGSRSLTSPPASRSPLPESKPSLPRESTPPSAAAPPRAIHASSRPATGSSGRTGGPSSAARRPDRGRRRFDSPPSAWLVGVEWRSTAARRVISSRGRAGLL